MLEWTCNGSVVITCYYYFVQFGLMITKWMPMMKVIPYSLKHLETIKTKTQPGTPCGWHIGDAFMSEVSMYPQRGFSTLDSQLYGKGPISLWAPTFWKHTHYSLHFTAMRLLSLLAVRKFKDKVVGESYSNLLPNIYIYIYFHIRCFIRLFPKSQT